MRVPSVVLPIALRWLVKAQCGLARPLVGEVLVKWPLASTSPVVDLTTNVPVCVPPTWKVSSVKMQVEDVGEDEVDRGVGVGPGHSASEGW